MPIRFNLEKYVNDVYIETGFYLGESVLNAKNFGFKELHSIEINEPFAINGINKIKELGLENKIKIHIGTSRKILKDLISKIDSKITFYLDAHDLGYEGTKMFEFESVDNCPVIEELNIIKEHKIKEHTIIIDDIRIFDGTDNNNVPYSWAKETGINSQVIKQKILEINPNYKFKFDNGVINDDVLIAYI